MPRTSPSLAAVLLSLITTGAWADVVDFERDVKPILVKSCVRCHGPKKREGGLALDVKARAFAGGDGGAVIVPGDSKKSLLFQYVAGLDEDTVMPPDGDELPPEQVAILRNWIDQGAPWPVSAAEAKATEAQSSHWSFKAPIRPALPTLKDPSWVRNPIDAFVLARLEKEGLSPSPEADRTTLIRRLSLDLIGLPPSIEEVDAFLADDRPDAYERLVERLLASPHYGERWGRFWLDRARFADTNGYEKDRERSAWPYRDWVINALNENMPFDRFTIDQIAGDMIPGAPKSSLVATGFHRNTMLNEEGGIDVEEFRFASVVDRVATTGTVWLGLSIQCAQCHSHKYDPITQREYYRLFAFLNNADEPELELPSPEIVQHRKSINDQIRALEASRAGMVADLDAKQSRWEATQHPVRWSVVRPSRVTSKKHATMTVLDDGSVLASGDKPNNDVYEVELIDVPADTTGLRLEVLPDPSLPDGGPGRAPLFSVGDFLLSEFTVDALDSDDPKSTRRVTLSDASDDFHEDGHPSKLAIDGVSDTGWSVRGAIGKPHAAVFHIKGDVGKSKTLVVTLHQEYIHQMTIGRFRLSVTRDAGSFKASPFPAEIETTLLVSNEARTSSQTTLIRDQFLSVTPELAEFNKTIQKLCDTRPKDPTTLVMRERSAEHARVTKIHKRGEFLKELNPVTPGVPASLHAMPADAPANRLGFAGWLVSRDNPLVGRVVMNQVWQTYFGRGIVSTVEDFGTQGARPTHPELLDWLAVEFPSSGWSLKAMHRMIVSSATYRQSSKASSELQARDPRNELLARGPRFRVDAEVVRDVALAASGLLNQKLGGPSVFPPQPEGSSSLSYGGGGWTISTGGDRYRRGLYTFLRRTAPYASFIVMDAPNSDTTCVRRERSNTPLQALTLLNDAVFVEAAQALGRRVVDNPSLSTDVSRATTIFRLCLSRLPRPDELKTLLTFYERQRSRLVSGELNPFKVASLDPKSSSDRATDLAAWTVVARAVLNLDETVTKE